MGVVVFCDHDQSAGFFVEAVHDAGAQFSAHGREGREMMQQGVDQGAAVATVFFLRISVSVLARNDGAGTGVDHHSGGLVDDGQIVVFKDDIERDIFGDGAERRALGHAEYGDTLAAAELQRGFGGNVVHENFLLGDERLDAGAADVETGGQELVEALAGGVGLNGECGRRGGGHVCRDQRLQGGMSAERRAARVGVYTCEIFLSGWAKIFILLQLR